MVELISSSKAFLGSHHGRGALDFILFSTLTFSYFYGPQNDREHAHVIKSIKNKYKYKKKSNCSFGWNVAVVGMFTHILQSQVITDLLFTDNKTYWEVRTQTSRALQLRLILHQHIHSISAGDRNRLNSPHHRHPHLHQSTCIFHLLRLRFPPTSQRDHFSYPAYQASLMGGGGRWWAATWSTRRIPRRASSTPVIWYVTPHTLSLRPISSRFALKRLWFVSAGLHFPDMLKFWWRGNYRRSVFFFFLCFAS